MRDTSLYDSGSNVKPGSDFLTLTTWNLLVLFCFAAPSVKTYSQKRRCSFPVVQLEKRPPLKRQSKSTPISLRARYTGSPGRHATCSAAGGVQVTGLDRQTGGDVDGGEQKEGAQDKDSTHLPHKPAPRQRDS